jgi:lipoic acid synthetase
MGSKRRLPSWLKRKMNPSRLARAVKRGLRRDKLNTVCEEARCPNQAECFDRKTATYLIMGPNCTRLCGFCDVKSGEAVPLDPDEPKRVAHNVKSLGLKHVVVTSVTRDDLPDGGAKHFAATINEIRRVCPNTTVEVLIPDFGGSREALKIVCEAKPDVLNHNIETVRRLTETVRNKARYKTSLEVLSTARELMPSGRVKSGLMLGLGESMDEVHRTMRDLRAAGVDTLTIGQYMQPSRSAIPVQEFIHPDHFEYLAHEGEEMGFEKVFAGPLVRSSYRAGELTD